MDRLQADARGNKSNGATGVVKGEAKLNPSEAAKSTRVVNISLDDRIDGLFENSYRKTTSFYTATEIRNMYSFFHGERMLSKRRGESPALTA